MHVASHRLTRSEAERVGADARRAERDKLHLREVIGAERRQRPTEAVASGDRAAGWLEQPRLERAAELVERPAVAALDERPRPPLDRIDEQIGEEIVEVPRLGTTENGEQGARPRIAAEEAVGGGTRGEKPPALEGLEEVVADPSQFRLDPRKRRVGQPRQFGTHQFGVVASGIGLVPLEKRTVGGGKEKFAVAGGGGVRHG